MLLVIPRVRKHDITTTDAALARKYETTYRNIQQLDRDYAGIPNITSISEYKQAAISYIAGMLPKWLARNYCALLALQLLDQKQESLYIPLSVSKTEVGY